MPCIAENNFWHTSTLIMIFEIIGILSTLFYIFLVIAGLLISRNQYIDYTNKFKSPVTKKEIILLIGIPFIPILNFLHFIDYMMKKEKI
jgi:hypothetical protein